MFLVFFAVGFPSVCAEKRTGRDPLKDPVGFLNGWMRGTCGVPAVRSDAACPVFRLKKTFRRQGNMLDLIG